MGEQDLMHYERMMQDALRGVLRSILERAASADGLPPPHHLFIQFRTDYPGVILPDRLKAEYPQEMTIVFKTHYWDLEVGAEAFEVTMSFHQKPEHLRVPIASVTQVVDPSVPFGLQFTVELPKLLEREKPPIDADDSLPGENVVSLDAFRKKN